MEYRDIHNFKRIYKELVETDGKPQDFILKESGLTHPTLKQILNSDKDHPPKIKSTTLAKIQKFNDQYITYVRNQIGFDKELDETLGEERDYFGRKTPPTMEEENAVRLKTLDECDVFDLLRQLSLHTEINLNITIKI